LVYGPVVSYVDAVKVNFYRNPHGQGSVIIVSNGRLFISGERSLGEKNDYKPAPNAFSRSGENMLHVQALIVPDLPRKEAERVSPHITPPLDLHHQAWMN
jgi:hypothetical protein